MMIPFKLIYTQYGTDFYRLWEKTYYSGPLIRTGETRLMTDSGWITTTRYNKTQVFNLMVVSVYGTESS